MIDFGKLIAKYTLPTAVALTLGWLLLSSYQADVKAAVAEAQAIRDTVHMELVEMKTKNARMEAMIEMLLRQEGLPIPTPEDVAPATDSIITDSTEADTT